MADWEVYNPAMAEQNNQDLQFAEQLLREGKKQEARTLLVGYVRNNPSSIRGWWMLSFALTDPKQQIDCVERVLRLNPNYSPARARLEKLKRSVQPSVSPFAESSPSQSAAPFPAPQKPASRPRRKANSQILQYAVLAVMACVAMGVIGFGAVMIVRGASGVPMQSAPPVQPTAITPILLPPTWTMTPTETLIPTQTLAPTNTPPAIPTLATSTALVLPTIAIPKPEVGVVQGASAPDFKLTNVATDKKVKLSDYEGKAVLIFFWATWCQYCEMEMPEVQKIYQAYRDQGFVVLAIDVGETAGKARKYRDKHSLTFPILNDDGSDVSSKYRVSAFPTHFFVTPSGVISSVNVGTLNYGGLNTKVRSMLNLPP
ncbi:Thiol-disulfide oxidoreductase ResA [Anaerolineales bacterium]|nr:Thiol-disulfide oxidoreductase ResA [Anaerolineales bacterium]